MRLKEIAGWLLAATMAVGCSSSSPRLAPATTAAIRTEEHRPWSLSPPIGISLPDEAVVHVVSKGVGCSGTLITNSLVLTAHHCIVERNADGEILERDLPASALEVELGGDYLPWATVKVTAALAPKCGYRGGHGDIAVLVLSRRLMGLAMMPLRLSEPPKVNEPIEPVGFGRCPLSNDGIHRIRREGGPIDRISPFAIFASASICPGDSGGPARSRVTGEAVGVVSAGVMDDNDETRDPATFTRLDIWRSLFANAQLVAQGSSPSEVPPISGCESD